MFKPGDKVKALTRRLPFWNQSEELLVTRHGLHEKDIGKFGLIDESIANEYEADLVLIKEKVFEH